MIQAQKVKLIENGYNSIAHVLQYWFRSIIDIASMPTSLLHLQIKCSCFLLLLIRLSVSQTQTS